MCEEDEIQEFDGWEKQLAQFASQCACVARSGVLRLRGGVVFLWGTIP